MLCQSKQFHNPRQRGFTVLELMTVVSIIIVLIGILIPVVNVALRDSKKNAMVAMMNAIKTGLQQYEGDMGAYPPSDWEKLGKSPRKVMNEWEGGEILTQMLLGHFKFNRIQQITGSAENLNTP